VSGWIEWTATREQAEIIYGRSSNPKPLPVPAGEWEGITQRCWRSRVLTSVKPSNVVKELRKPGQITTLISTVATCGRKQLIEVGRSSRSGTLEDVDRDSSCWGAIFMLRSSKEILARCKLICLEPGVPGIIRDQALLHRQRSVCLPDWVNHKDRTSTGYRFIVCGDLV